MVDALRDRKALVRDKVELLMKDREDENVNLSEKIEQMESIIKQIASFQKDLQDCNLVFKKIFIKFLSYKDNTDVLDNYENNLN